MNNYVSRLSNFDIMTICSNNFRAALSVFFDMGCPQITIKCTEDGITITETDSAAAVVVAAAFERLSFQVYSIPKDGVIFTIDTSTIVQSLKTSSINCCTFFNFITDDNDVAEKFVVTRCTESMAKVAVGVDYNENDDQSVSIMKKKRKKNRSGGGGRGGDGLKFVYKMDVLGCPPSEVMFDVEMLSLFKNKLVFLLRHSTFLSIIKEFNRLGIKMVSILNYQDDPKKIMIHGGGDGTDDRQELEISLGDDDDDDDDDDDYNDDYNGDGNGDGNGDVNGDGDGDVNGNGNEDVMDMGSGGYGYFLGINPPSENNIRILKTPPRGEVIKGTFSCKRLSSLLKTQCSKIIEISLIPQESESESSDSDDNDDDNDNDSENKTKNITMATLVVRQEVGGLGNISVIIPTEDV